MTLTDDQIKAIKIEGRKIYPKIREIDLGYPNPLIPEALLSEIKEFFKKGRRYSRIQSSRISDSVL